MIQFELLASEKEEEKNVIASSRSSLPIIDGRISPACKLGSYERKRRPKKNLLLPFLFFLLQRLESRRTPLNQTTKQQTLLERHCLRSHTLLAASSPIDFCFSRSSSHFSSSTSHSTRSENISSHFCWHSRCKMLLKSSIQS